MRCPNCGKEVPNDAKFCSQCGYAFPDQPRKDDPAHEIHNTATSIGPTGSVGSQTTLMDRNSIEFQNGVKRCMITSSIAFAFSLISVGGSLILKLTNYSNAGLAAGLIMLFLGMIGFIVLMFGFTVPLGKRMYGSAQPKGFKENFPGIMMGLGMVAVFGALFIQGIILIIS